MMKTVPELSACCNAMLTIKTDKYFGSNNYACSSCDKRVYFAISGTRRHYDYDEAPGVFSDHKGGWWFAYQQTSCVEHITSLLNKGETIVCQVKDVVNTMGLRYNTQDTDFLGKDKHNMFISDYNGKVKNPMIHSGK